jgi:hypothetical protein
VVTGSLTALTALALGALLVAAQRHERWRPGDPITSRVARLARRPSMRRIRAALAAAQARSVEEGPDPVATQPREPALDALQATPGRLVVGEQSPGTPVAIDIPQLHGLALTGPGADGAARGLLVSLLSHHDIANAEVILTERVAASLMTLPGSTPGLSSGPLDTLLTRLDAEITYQRQTLARDQQTSWVERLGGPDPLPAFLAVLSANDIAGAHLSRLTTAVQSAQGLAIAVLLLGDPPPDAPWIYPIPVSLDGAVPKHCAPVLAGATTLHMLTAAEASELMCVIACGRGPDIVPELPPRRGGARRGRRALHPSRRRHGVTCRPAGHLTRRCFSASDSNSPARPPLCL